MQNPYISQFATIIFNSLFSQIRYPFPKRQILNSSELKEFAEDNFNFGKNGRKLSKWVENTVGKEEIAHNE